MTSFPRAKTIRFNDVTNTGPGVGYYSVRSPFSQRFRGSFLRANRWSQNEHLAPGSLRFPGNVTNSNASHSVITSTPANRRPNTTHTQPLRNQLLELSSISHAPGTTGNVFDVSCQPNPDSLPVSPAKIDCVSCRTFEKQLNEEVFVRRQLEDQIRAMTHEADQLEASLQQMDSAANTTDAALALNRLENNHERVSHLVSQLVENLRIEPSGVPVAQATEACHETFDVCVQANPERGSNERVVYNIDDNAAVIAKQNKILSEALRKASDKITKILEKNAQHSSLSNESGDSIEVKNEPVSFGEDVDICIEFNRLISDLNSQLDKLKVQQQKSSTEEAPEWVTLRAEHALLGKELDEQKALVEKYSKDLEIVNAQLAAMESEFNHLNSAYDVEVSEKASLKRENADLNSFIEELEKDLEAQLDIPSGDSEKLDASDIERKEMKDSMCLLREHIHLTMNQMTNLNKEATVTKSMNTDLETQVYCLQQTVDIMEKQISTFTRETSKLRKDINCYRLENDNLTEQISELQVENIDLEKTKVCMEKDLSSMTQKYQAALKVSESLKNSESRLEKDLSIAKEKMTNLEASMSKELSTHSELSEKLLKNEGVISGLKTELSRSKNELSELQSANFATVTEFRNSLACQESQSSSVISDLERQRSDLLSQLDKMRGDFDAVTLEKSSMVKDLNSKCEELKSLQQSCSSMRANDEKLISDLSSMRKEFLDVTHQKDAIASKLASALKQCEELKNEVHSLSENVKREESEVKTLKLSLEDNARTYKLELANLQESFRNEKSELLKEIEVSNLRSDSLQSQIESLCSQLGLKNQSYSSVLTKVASQLTELTTTITAQDEERKSLQQKHDQTCENYKSTVSSLNTQVSCLHMEMKSLELAHKHDLATLQNQISGFKDKVAQLESEKSSLENEVSAINEKNAREMQLIDNQVQQLEKKLEQDNLAQEKQVSDLNSQIASLNERIEQCLDEKRELQEKHDSVIFQMNEQLVELESEKNRLQKEFSEEKESFERQSETFKSQVQNLESTLQQQTAKHQAFLTELNAKMADLRSEAVRSANENQILKDKQEAMVCEHSKRVCELRSELDTACQERCILKSDVERLNHENDELKHTVDETRAKNCDLIQKVENSDRENRQAEETLEKMRCEQDETVSQLSSLNISFQELTCEKEVLSECLSKTKHELSESNIIINSLRQDLKDKSSEVSSNEKRCLELVQKLDVLKSDYESEKENADSLAVKNHKATMEIEKLSSQCLLRGNEITELKERERDFETQVEQLQTTIKDLKNDLYTIQGNIEVLQNENHQMEQELQSKSANSSLVGEFEELKQELNSVKLKSSEEISRLEAENRQFLLKIFELRDSLESYEGSNQYGDYKEEYFRLVAENEELKQKVEDNCKVIEKKSSDILNLEGKLSSREAQLSAALTSNSKNSILTQQLEETKSRVLELENYNDSLKNEAVERSSYIEDLEKKLTKIEEQNSKNLLLQNSKNVLLNRQLQEAKSRVTELQELYQNSNREAEKQYLYVTEMETKIANLQTQLSSALTEGSQSSMLQNQLDESQARVLQLEQKNTELQVNLEVKNKSQSEIQKKVFELIRSITKLELRVSKKDLSDNLKEHEIFDVLNELDNSRMSLQQFEETFRTQQALLMEKESALRRLTMELNRTTENLEEVKKTNVDLSRKVSNTVPSDDLLRTLYENVLAEKTSIEQLYEKLTQKVEPFKELLASYDAEKQLMMERSYQSEAQYNDLADRYAKLLGHQNNKQKIKHIQKLKCDNIRLNKENTELREDLHKMNCELKLIVQKDLAKAAKACTVASRNAANPTNSVLASSGKVLKENTENNCLQ